MKCHPKIYPHTPALPAQKAHAPAQKFSPNGSKVAPDFRPERSQELPLERTAATATGGEIDEIPLVYVVDDEPGLADLYTIILEANGYAVKAFTSRVETLAELKGATKKPGLLIMDYLGHSLAVDWFMQHCLQANPNLRFLVASGFSEFNTRFSSVTPDRYIQKPFTADEFLHEVAAALAV
jgi:CheY-like chemotaxis protein